MKQRILVKRLWIYTLAALFGWFFAQPLFAKDDLGTIGYKEADCKKRDLSSRRTVPLKGDALGWLQTFGDDYVTGSDYHYNAVMINLKTGERFKIGGAPGDIDPYPTPDGKYIVHPLPTRFFDPKDLIAHKQRAQYLYAEDDNRGWYQSVGLVEQSHESTTYRVLVGQGIGEIQDYVVTPASGVKAWVSSKPDFKAKYSPRVEACNNLDRKGLDFETPILSRKRADLLAFRHRESGNTRVYKLKMPQGHCDLVLDLGKETSKISFDFEDQRIAYITERSVAERNQLGRRQSWPQVEMVDLRTGQVKVMTAPNEMPLAQTFSSRGELVVSQLKKDSNSLVYLHWNDVPAPDHPLYVSAQRIGQMWANKCLNFQLDPLELATIGARLSLEDCRQLVSRSASETEDVDALLSYCGQRAEAIQSPNSTTK